MINYFTNHEVGTCLYDHDGHEYEYNMVISLTTMANLIVNEGHLGMISLEYTIIPSEGEQ